MGYAIIPGKMIDDKKPRAPRFRIVVEITFDDADPWDPSGYSDLLARWVESLAKDASPSCSNINVRESMTIGDVDDYEDWRRERGAYDVSTWPTESTGYVRRRDDEAEP